MDKIFYIQLSGQMIPASGAFLKGLFDDGKYADNTVPNRVRARQLALYKTYGKIKDNKHYYYIYGTHTDALTCHGPFTNGFFMYGEKSNIANYNINTKYVFKPLDIEEDNYFRFFDDELVNEIGQQYNIVTPAGTHVHTISSPNVLRLLTDDKISDPLLHEFDVYSVKWPSYGSLLNDITVSDGVSSFLSDAEGSYYAIYTPNNNNQLQPILVAVTDPTGSTISTIEGNGIKIGEYESNQGGGTFSYYSSDTLVYQDISFNYYPYYQESFTFGAPDNNATIKRVLMGVPVPNIDTNDHIWNITTATWDSVSSGNNGGGSGDGGSGDGGSNDPFVVTIGSMTFNLGNSYGEYLQDDTFLSSDSTFIYTKSSYTDFVYDSTIGNMTWATVHTVKRFEENPPFGNIYLGAQKWYFNTQEWSS